MKFLMMEVKPGLFVTLVCLAVLISVGYFEGYFGSPEMSPSSRGFFVDTLSRERIRQAAPLILKDQVSNARKLFGRDTPMELRLVKDGSGTVRGCGVLWPMRDQAVLHLTLFPWKGGSSQVKAYNRENVTDLPPGYRVTY